MHMGVTLNPVATVCLSMLMSLGGAYLFFSATDLHVLLL